MEVYIANYIFIQADFGKGHDKTEQAIKSIDIVTRNVLKLSQQEIEQMKRKAKEDAKSKWRTVTRSL